MVAIISGAGRGLGKASAIAMAKEGASVVVLSRTVAEIEDTAQRIEASGGKVLYLQADIARPEDISMTVFETLSMFGRIDILMNNAAIIGPVKNIFEITQEEWNMTFNINLRGAFLLSREVLPHMIHNGSGKIINVTSGLGVMVMPLFGAYSITKAGLIHFTKALAEELRETHIQVNGLDPGVIDTRMQEYLRSLGPSVLGKEIYEQFRSLKDQGHLRPPEEIARLAVFLASRASDAVTGENGTESVYRRYGYHGL